MDMSDAASSTDPSAPSSDLTVTLPDGRLLGYAVYGDPSGLPVLGLHGTPGSRLMFRMAHPVAQGLGIRLISPERPGFGISTYQPGRTLASYALDIADFADALAIERFAVAGRFGRRSLCRSLRRIAAGARDGAGSHKPGGSDGRGGEAAPPSARGIFSFSGWCRACCRCSPALSASAALRFFTLPMSSTGS